ncbi:hypothetical protein GQ600_25945 [Phytophthora cactorum]|nr:hypothetical protein GQ600_25945 [Phytophthora cactorum]
MMVCVPGESALNTQSEDVEMVRAERMSSVGINASLSGADLRVSVETAKASSGLCRRPRKLLVENGLLNRKRKAVRGRPSHARLFMPEEIDLMMQGSTIGADKEEEERDRRSSKNGFALSTKSS